MTRTLAGHPSCVGAAALTGRPGRCHRQRHGRIVPTPVAAAADKSAAWASVSGKRTCFANLPAYRVHVCHFGRGGARTRIALVGNSHAAEWLPAFQVLMAREGWSVTTYLAARCALADVPQQVGTPAQTQACQAWVHHVANDVARGHYDLVVFTNRISVLAVGETEAGSQSAYQRGYAAVLHRLRAAGEPVLAIRDTPYPGRPVPDCLAAHPHDYPACDGTRRSWLPHDPVAAAVRQLRDRQLRYADLTRYVCGPRRCGAVVGGVVVYFDGSHLTATYARTIAPYLLPDVTAALR